VPLQRAICLRYADGRTLSRKRVETIARRWNPWRTVAT
jgi:3-methyladenine DNA glycosylase/8-oxoguanine DNA glycosylase